MSSGSRSSVRALALVVIGLSAAALVGPLLPRISLDTWFANAVVRLTDTGSWGQLTPISILAVVVLAAPAKPGRSSRRSEAGALALVMLVALAGNAQLNEHVVKPMFGIPRPNIVALAESGALGPGLPDATSFYATGDKEARRAVLRERLTEETTPQLSSLVRAHWIHETGYSFPSGHTTAAVTLAVLLAAVGAHWHVGWRRAVALYAVPVWAIAVAYSRILLEVHTPWDVLGGTAAGVAWGLVAFVAAGRLAGRRDPLPR